MYKDIEKEIEEYHNLEKLVPSKNFKNFPEKLLN